MSAATTSQFMEWDSHSRGSSKLSHPPAALPARLRLLVENVMYDDQAEVPKVGN